MPRAPMVAHLRPPNLRDMLVRAKLPPVDRRGGAGRRPQLGFRRCGKVRCLCCVYCVESRTHTSTATGQTWPMRQLITCEDRNLIYGVTCQHGRGRCPSRPQYIGMVGCSRAGRERCTEHRGSVSNHRDNAVGEHFSQPGHSLDDFSFQAIEKVRSRDPFVIKARESFWIGKYGVLDQGLNREK
jgi:hypothetical protein